MKLEDSALDAMWSDVLRRVDSTPLAHGGVTVPVDRLRELVDRFRWLAVDSCAHHDVLMDIETAIRLDPAQRKGVGAQITELRGEIERLRSGINKVAEAYLRSAASETFEDGIDAMLSVLPHEHVVGTDAETVADALRAFATGASSPAGPATLPYEDFFETIRRIAGVLNRLDVPGASIEARVEALAEEVIRLRAGVADERDDHVDRLHRQSEASHRETQLLGAQMQWIASSLRWTAINNEGRTLWWHAEHIRAHRDRMSTFLDTLASIFDTVQPQEWRGPVTTDMGRKAVSAIQRIVSTLGVAGRRFRGCGISPALRALATGRGEEQEKSAETEGVHHEDRR